MGIIGQAFGWMTGVENKSLADLDIETMESNLRQNGHLRDGWEREIRQTEKEYRDMVSVDANAARTPIQRKLAFQKGAILMKKMCTLTSSVNMLYKVSGAVEQLKMLKQFYIDLTGSMKLPKGLTVAQALPQIYRLIDTVGARQGELESIIASIPKPPEFSRSDSDIDTALAEINKLYDEYNTNLAKNDESAAAAVYAKIELKKAEMEKRMGICSAE